MCWVFTCLFYYVKHFEKQFLRRYIKIKLLLLLLLLFILINNQHGSSKHSKKQRGNSENCSLYKGVTE